MIVFSYLWYFWRNLRLPDFGLMARRQSMTLISRRTPIALVDIVTTAIHGWDVCWLDLELLRDCPMSDLLNYLETWPLAHRLLLVRSHSPLHWPHDEARFCFEGKLPAPDDGAFYIYSSRSTPNGVTRFDRDRFISGKRNSLHTTCDFYLIERDGVPIGITGLYTADFWPGIGWGGWGAINREAAFRQTIFEPLRLTEELARARDLQWRSNIVLPEPAPAMIAVWRRRTAVGSSTSSLPTVKVCPIAMTDGMPIAGEGSVDGCSLAAGD